MFVTMSVFSGRRDPTLRLNAEQSGWLLKKIFFFPPAYQDFPDLGHVLGFRGFEVWAGSDDMKVSGHLVLLRKGRESRVLLDEKEEVQNFLFDAFAAAPEWADLTEKVRAR